MALGRPRLAENEIRTEASVERIDAGWFVADFAED
jgi:hypothetical protein